MYEYSLISEVADVKLEKVAITNKDGFTKNLQASLSSVIFRVKERMMADFQGGDWEIISHQLNNLDRYLVVTFLIRRPKGCDESQIPSQKSALKSV